MKDDHYRLIGIYLIVVLAIIAWCVTGIVRHCGSGSVEESRDTLIVVMSDTIVRLVHDTLPAQKGETIVKYVDIPVYISDSTKKDSLPIVQKEYSDDSTYTAYVSGLKYEEWPKLDSVNVRQREITKTIHETITLTEKEKAPKIGFGIQAGYGYGILSNRFEPYVGIGIHYNF